MDLSHNDVKRVEPEATRGLIGLLVWRSHETSRNAKLDEQV